MFFLFVYSFHALIILVNSFLHNYLSLGGYVAALDRCRERVLMQLAGAQVTKHRRYICNFSVATMGKRLPTLPLLSVGLLGVRLQASAGGRSA